MTHQKIISLIQELHLVFDIVRLVDITNNTQYTLNDANELEPSPYKCYTVWNRDQVCNNCISARACCNKTRIEKFEVIGHEVCPLPWSWWLTSRKTAFSVPAAGRILPSHCPTISSRFMPIR